MGNIAAMGAFLKFDVIAFRKLMLPIATRFAVLELLLRLEQFILRFNVDFESF